MFCCANVFELDVVFLYLFSKPVVFDIKVFGSLGKTRVSRTGSVEEDGGERAL